MIAAVGMSKGVEGIGVVHTELFRGDEHSAGGAKGDVAATFAHGAGANSGSGVIAGAGSDLHGGGDTQLGSDFGKNGADAVIALEELGHLVFGNAADGQHFFAPALMLHVQQQHTGGVGIVTGVNAGEDVVDVVLGQHDLGDLIEVFRLIFLHPQDLGSGKTGKGNVGGHGGELLLANYIV